VLTIANLAVLFKHFGSNGDAFQHHREGLRRMYIRLKPFSTTRWVSTNPRYVYMDKFSIIAALV